MGKRPSLARGLQILQISRKVVSAWKHTWDSLVIIYLFSSCLVAFDLLSNNSATNKEGFTFLALQMWWFPYNPILFSHRSRGNWIGTDRSWYKPKKTPPKMQSWVFLWQTLIHQHTDTHESPQVQSPYSLLDSPRWKIPCPWHGGGQRRREGPCLQPCSALTGDGSTRRARCPAFSRAEWFHTRLLRGVTQRGPCLWDALSELRVSTPFPAFRHKTVQKNLLQYKTLTRRGKRRYIRPAAPEPGAGSCGGAGAWRQPRWPPALLCLPPSSLLLQPPSLLSFPSTCFALHWHYFIPFFYL